MAFQMGERKAGGKGEAYSRLGSGVASIFAGLGERKAKGKLSAKEKRGAKAAAGGAARFGMDTARRLMGGGR